MKDEVSDEELDNALTIMDEGLMAHLYRTIDVEEMRDQLQQRIENRDTGQQ